MNRTKRSKKVNQDEIAVMYHMKNEDPAWVTSYQFDNAKGTTHITLMQP
jgi:hypothetical protein